MLNNLPENGSDSILFSAHVHIDEHESKIYYIAFGSEIFKDRVRFKFKFRECFFFLRFFSPMRLQMYCY